MLFGIIIFFALVRWVFKIMVTSCRPLLHFMPFETNLDWKLEHTIKSFLVNAAMWIPILGYTTSPESVSYKISIKYWWEDLDKHYLLVKSLHWVRIGTVWFRFGIYIFSAPWVAIGPRWMEHFENGEPCLCGSM